MRTILPKLPFAVKERLLRNLRRCRDARLRTHYLIVITLNEGLAVAVVAQNQKVHRDTVYRIATRFRERGELGLLDGRANNGPGKLDRGFLDTLNRLVRGSPQDHGWRRPTWTRELLVLTLPKLGKAQVHVATLSRPRPTVDCPWPIGRKTRRLNEIRRLVKGLPRNEVALYEDEVDIHLNPKIGYDWMGTVSRRKS